MKIFGTSYYFASRYDHCCIDSTHDNSSSSNSLMTGIKPMKLGREIMQKIHSVQYEALSQLSLSILIGDTGNSEELYLFTENRSEIYHEHLEPALRYLKDTLERFSDVAHFPPGSPQRLRPGNSMQGHFGRCNEPYTLTTLFGKAYEAFRAGANTHNDEHLKWDGDRRVFSPLDISICAHQFLEANIGEWELNGLFENEKTAQTN